MHCLKARGGKGTRGAKLRDDDNVEDVLQVTAKQTVFLLGRDGICHRIKAHNIPEASRTAAGTPIAQVRTLPHQSLLAGWLYLYTYGVQEILQHVLFIVHEILVV